MGRDAKILLAKGDYFSLCHVSSELVLTGWGELTYLNALHLCTDGWGEVRHFRSPSQKLPI